MRYIKGFLLLCLVVFVWPLLAAGEEAPEALQYVIASHESLPSDRWGDFLVELLALRRGNVRISLYKGDTKSDPLKSWVISPEPMKPRNFRFSGKVGGKALPEGKYLFRFQPAANPGEAHDVPLRVTPPEGPLPIQPTVRGQFLPRDMSDEAIWEALMAPLAVVDIGATDHMALRDAPGGKKIGEVHGQTAGLVVRRVEGDHALVGAYATDCGSYIEGYVPLNKLKVKRPNPRYGLLIDKNRQVLSVYERGKKLGELKVSTGLMVRERLLRETRAGAFFTGDRQLSFVSDGFRYDYALRVDGGNLIHELGQTRQDGFAEHLATMGQKVSKGCIRVTNEVTEEGLSAFWLWTHLPRDTKLIMLDDPEARKDRLTALFGDVLPDTFSPRAPRYAPEDGARRIPVERDQPLPADQKTSVLITFTGDCILGSEEKSRAKIESFDSFIMEKGLGWPFSGMRDVFEGDDLSVINLEGVLKDDTVGKAGGKMHWFRGPMAFAQILPKSGIDLAGLANNHVEDYGIPGRISTKQALRSAGIPFFGFGDLYIYEKDGIKIGFAGIRETTWKEDRLRPQREIEDLREMGCHYIVYTCHFGTEYRPVNKLQREIARQVVDAGADLVVGTHPHVVQGIEKYKQGLILYSLGNFTFGGNLELTEFDGLVAQIQLDFMGDSLSKSTLRLIPVLTTGTKPNNDFRPIRAEAEDKARILARIQEQSEMEINEVMVFPAE